MYLTITLSVLASLIVSVSTHIFILNKLEKMVDDFFDTENKVFRKYAEDIKAIVLERLQQEH